MKKIFIPVFIALLIYFVMQNNFMNMYSTYSPPIKSKQINTQDDQAAKNDDNISGNFLERTMSNVLANILKTEEGKAIFAQIIQPMYQPLNGELIGYKVNNSNIIDSMFHINILQAGAGKNTVCGQKVVINYKIYDLTGNLLSTENDKHIRLGENMIVPSLDAVIVGMKKGEKRSALITDKYINYATHNLSSDKKTTYNAKFDIELISAEDLPYNYNDVRMFDDEMAYTVPLLCGMETSFDMKVTDLTNNKTLYDTKGKDQIKMRIGQPDYPLILSFLIHNKIPVGTRTAIIQAFMLKDKTFGNNIKIDNKNSYLMIELSDFPSIIGNRLHENK
jgi:hypothetical protein